MDRRDFIRVSGLGLFALSSLGPASCGGAEDEAQTISWQAIPTYSLQSTDPKRVEYIEQKLQQWQNQNEGWTIEPAVSSEDIAAAMARLLQQADQGRAPDVAQVDSYIFPRFSDYAQSVDRYLQRSEVQFDDWFPPFRDVMTGGGSDILGFQFTTDVRVLYYRKDLIDDPPQSWDEVVETGRALTAQGMDGFLYPAGRGEAAVVTSLLPYYWALGGELVDDQGNILFAEGDDRERMLECLRFIDTTVSEGITPQRVASYTLEDDLNQDVAAQKTGMFLGGNWQVAALQDIMGSEEFLATWDVAAIPSQNGQAHATTAGGWVWGFFSDDPQVLEQATDFILDAYVSDEGMASWCNVGGYLPPRESVFDHPQYEGNQYTQTFRDHLQNYANVRPATESYQDISTQLQIAVSSVASGEKSPEEVLADTIGNLT